MSNKKFKIGNADIQEHINWCKNELEPPVKVDRELKYVIECFLQTLEELKKRV